MKRSCIGPGEGRLARQHSMDNHEAGKYYIHCSWPRYHLLSNATPFVMGVSSMISYGFTSRYTGQDRW